MAELIWTVTLYSPEGVFLNHRVQGPRTTTQSVGPLAVGCRSTMTSYSTAQIQRTVGDCSCSTASREVARAAVPNTSNRDSLHALLWRGLTTRNHGHVLKWGTSCHVGDGSTQAYNVLQRQSENVNSAESRRISTALSAFNSSQIIPHFKQFPKTVCIRSAGSSWRHPWQTL